MSLIYKKETENLKINQNNFGGLLEGNGTFVYTNSALNYIFKRWSTKERLIKTKKIFL